MQVCALAPLMLLLGVGHARAAVSHPAFQHMKWNSEPTSVDVGRKPSAKTKRSTAKEAQSLPQATYAAAVVPASAPSPPAEPIVSKGGVPMINERVAAARSAAVIAATAIVAQLQLLQASVAGLDIPHAVAGGASAASAAASESAAGALVAVGKAADTAAVAMGAAAVAGSQVASAAFEKLCTFVSGAAPPSTLVVTKAQSTKTKVMSLKLLMSRFHALPLPRGPRFQRSLQRLRSYLPRPFLTDFR